MGEKKISGAVVGIIMGSASDVEIMKLAKETLQEFGITSEMRVMSAHRTPQEACAWAASAKADGKQVIIAAAGMAAHLAGVVAAHTTLPVLGVPLPGGVLDGMDSLLSTVQMPKGTPVATFAVGKAGAVNAALFAVRLLALGDEELARKVEAHKQNLAAEVLASDRKVQESK